MESELSEGEIDEVHPVPPTQDDMPAAYSALAKHSRANLGPETEGDLERGRGRPRERPRAT